jgi:hypothetical protein
VLPTCPVLSVTHLPGPYLLSGTTEVVPLEFLHFGEGGYIQIYGNARFFWSHRSDALYQRTTSVVPLKANKDMGFSPCAFFLCQVGVSVLL